MKDTKAQVLAAILRLAKGKQGKETEKCVELTAATRLDTLPRVIEKNNAIEDVAKALTDSYGVTFPTDVRSEFATIDNAADYIFNNAER
jgi:hypothetical protein